jgi:hypothetical protein
LLAAYRLPDDLFADAKVTVDIVFLRKGKSAHAPTWLKTPRKFISGRGMLLNEYYHYHAHHIIGKLAVVDMYKRKGLTCKKNCENPFEVLNKFIKSKPKANIENSSLRELKAQVSGLCEELHKLSQAFSSASQTLMAINQKIAAIEVSF